MVNGKIAVFRPYQLKQTDSFILMRFKNRMCTFNLKFFSVIMILTINTFFANLSISL
jgi:hypothetical protein